MSIQSFLLQKSKAPRYAFHSMLYRAFHDNSALLHLKDRHRFRPLLVVGNGPSLNRTPLDDFSNVPAIGMNKIDLIFPRVQWRPELIVCVNNLVARQHQDFFVASKIPVFLAWKTRLMLRRHNRPKLNYFDLNASNEFSTDATSGFGSSATVTYIALQIAYWMGAEPVVLFGVDHSFKFSGPKATYEKRSGDDENHFDPNYFRSGSVWGTPDLDQSEKDYKIARDAFEADGRHVFDATIEGRLAVFEKITVEEARSITKVGGR